MPPQLGAQDQYFDETDQSYDEPNQYDDEPDNYNDEAMSRKKKRYLNFSVMNDSKLITYSLSGLKDVILIKQMVHSC